MMRRRTVVVGLTALPFLAPVWRGEAQTGFEPLLADIEMQMAMRRASSQPIPADWVLSALGPQEPVAIRILIFELVRRMPYRLERWTGDPDSLFNLGHGDCRHKEAAQRRLLTLAGYQARPVQVLFDWADLPIPPDILAILPETRSFHDTVQTIIGGKSVIADATWDPALASVGFPVQPSWDGIGNTLAVTKGPIRVLRAGEIPRGVSAFEYVGLT